MNVLIILIVAILVITMAAIAPMLWHVHPGGPGYPVSFAPNAELVGDNGWIQPDLMQTHLYEALFRSFGHVEPLGNESKAVRKVTDTDTEGNRFDVYEGLWRSEFNPTSSSVLELLKESGMSDADLAGMQERRVELEYWTERHPTTKKPGRLHARLRVFVRAEGDDEEKRPPAALVPVLCDDLIRALKMTEKEDALSEGVDAARASRRARDTNR